MFEDNSATQNIVLEKTFSKEFTKPVQAVFEAWTNPKLISKWWGPHLFTTPICELDAEPGGTIRIHMKGPDGTIYPMEGVINEIDEPEKLSFTAKAFNENGDYFAESITTVTLANNEGKTKLTVTASVIDATPEAEGPLSGMEEGWKQSLDKLSKFLEKG
ncbi:MAG: SRPBCC domain-containing protein [FCB group bacterium]|jgi:uncharacterized protein YndB with AHSA1/START domain